MDIDRIGRFHELGFLLGSVFSGKPSDEKADILRHSCLGDIVPIEEDSLSKDRLDHDMLFIGVNYILRKN